MRSLWLVAFAFAAATPVRSDPRDSRGSAATIGVSVHTLDPALAPQYRAAGFRAVRTDLAWSSVRWADRWNWGPHDGFVRSLGESGLTPVLILWGSIYEDGHAPRNSGERAEFSEFCREASKRYSGRGVVWEIWNEANSDRFWKPVPDVGNYASLVAECSAEIRREDPSGQIVAGSSGGAETDWAFIRSFLATGVEAHLDAVAVHPYGVGAPENAWVFYRGLRTLTDLPIAVTEWGFSSEDQGVLGSLVGRALDANEKESIGLTVLYEWQDQPVHDRNMGVLQEDGTPKPAVLAAVAGRSY